VIVRAWPQHLQRRKKHRFRALLQQKRPSRLWSKNGSKYPPFCAVRRIKSTDMSSAASSLLEVMRQDNVQLSKFMLILSNHVSERNKV
jgi:hypothetical protein